MRFTKILFRLTLASFATLLLPQPAAALDANYWRGGWRTPLGEAPHIYEFVIRGSRVTGVYCRNCSDATTIGFIDGTWDEKAGIKFIGPGDLTTDEELQGMGDVALGVITAHHYSAAADRPANKAFVAAYKKEYGEKLYPGFLVVGAYDAMEAIFHVIREQKGKVDPDKTMALLKQYKNPNSPRGPLAIDPETRDVVQNEYLREVRKVGGVLANVEIETLATALKDPWKEFNKKK